MSDLDQTEAGVRLDHPGQTRTWWHPLLARLLDHVLAKAYAVHEEVLVGKLPLRVDILLIRREDGGLSEASRRELGVLLPLLNRFTLLQFKGPTDALQRGDLAQLVGCAFLWHGQQAEPIPHRDITLVILAPSLNEAVRGELGLLGCQINQHEPGIFRVDGLQFEAWLVETDVMAERGQPILSLVSRVFLRHRERIIEQLTRTGHGALLYYMLQQVQQFRSLGEGFAMQHKDSEYLGEVEEELQTAVLDAIPAERIARHVAREADDELQTAVLEAIPAEKRLRGLPPEDRLRGLSPEEVAAGLTEEQAARLRELLERKRSR